MIAAAPLRDAIVAHRAAYDAFQLAADDEAEDASCAMADALDALVLAACAFPLLTEPLPVSAGDLLEHLRWWLAEEAVHANDYQPEYGVLQARAADLAAALTTDRAAPLGRDPMFAAIDVADAAASAHTASLVDLNEGDDAEMFASNAAAHAASMAFEAVEATTPTTWAGLFALVEFYGRDLELYDRCSLGGGYFAHLAAAMLACDSSDAFWASTRQFAEHKQQLASVNPQADFAASEQVAA